MIGVRVKRSGSWLDPECAGLLGWHLGRRLWARVSARLAAGEKGVAITLTYRRDEYADAEDLYQSQKERQDVPLFMRRLGRVLCRNVTGDWICKAEFQQGGWLHFHIILMGSDYVDHAALSRAWGLGFVYIKRLTKKRVIYMVKYVAKGGRIPLFLYGEKPRSVKIIRTSKGFWGETSDDCSYCPVWARYGDKPLRMPGVYVPIGIKIRERGLVLRCVDRNGGKAFSTRTCDPGTALIALTNSHAVWPGNDGWLRIGCSPELAHLIIDRCGRGVADRPPREAEPRPRSGRLYLRGSRKRDAVDIAAVRLPWWKEAEYMEDALDAANFAE